MINGPGKHSVKTGSNVVTIAAWAGGMKALAEHWAVRDLGCRRGAALARLARPRCQRARGDLVDDKGPPLGGPSPYPLRTRRRRLMPGAGSAPCSISVCALDTFVT